MVHPAEWMRHLEDELSDKYFEAKKKYNNSGTVLTIAALGVFAILFSIVMSRAVTVPSTGAQTAIALVATSAVGIGLFLMVFKAIEAFTDRILTTPASELCRVVVHNQVGVEPVSLNATVLNTARQRVRATFTLYGIECAFDPISKEFSALWLERHVPSSLKLIDVLNNAHDYYSEKLAEISRLSSPQT